jgi:hypothetical protein
MLIDSKKLWTEGGYGRDNPYEIFIARVRAEARTHFVSQEELDLILIDFFIALRSDPMTYRTEGNKCIYCSCELTNSGTNATHYIFSCIHKKKDELMLIEQDRFTTALNQKITSYITKDNEEYIAKFGPKEEAFLKTKIAILSLLIIGLFLAWYYYGFR